VLCADHDAVRQADQTLILPAAPGGRPRVAAAPPPRRTAWSTPTRPVRGSRPLSPGVNCRFFTDRDSSTVARLPSRLTCIGDAAGVARFASRDHFAACNGTAPVEASSGNRKICRLSLRGNRRINHAIHMAAITQIRHSHSDGRAYHHKKLFRGQDPQRGAPVPQAPDQQRDLPLPLRRRPASWRSGLRQGPGRASGERL
jgi:hypothetical protein